MSVSKFLFRKLSDMLSSKKVYLAKSLSYKNSPGILEINLDYNRYATLELCAEEIAEKKVKGNVAELGVYKGDFAKRLNVLFPDCKLYLFDTFEGFHKNDIVIEQGEGFSDGKQDFSNTSVELVRSKMKYPQNCIFKKGYFPESATDVNDTFCFVSLDADLYAPIYEGLKFFYPKLLSGGFIFIHDYNNDLYSGAKQAVRQYCSENNISFTPIADSGGTAVISK